MAVLLKELRDSVLDANLELVRKGLVLSTFGNVSGICREQGLIAIKPSGVSYWEMKPEDIVITNLKGAIVDGKLRPSSDLQTHVALYQMFRDIGGVAHTHSEYATAWAQACKPIPCLGTTHADYFHGPVPVTREMTEEEVNGSYELNTGLAILHAFDGLDSSVVPAVLVANHGPFVWGADPREAAENTAILEAIARLAYFTLAINPRAKPIGTVLHNRHYLRKHGKNAYYGQVRKRSCAQTEG